MATTKEVFQANTSKASTTHGNPRRREHAPAEPPPQRLPLAAGTEHPQMSGVDLLVRIAVAGPDFGQRAHGGFDDHRHLVARIVAAQVGGPVLHHQPPQPLAARRIA